MLYVIELSALTPLVISSFKNWDLLFSVSLKVCWNRLHVLIHFCSFVCVYKIFSSFSLLVTQGCLDSLAQSEKGTNGSRCK